WGASWSSRRRPSPGVKRARHLTDALRASQVPSFDNLQPTQSQDLAHSPRQTRAAFRPRAWTNSSSPTSKIRDNATMNRRSRVAVLGLLAALVAVGAAAQFGGWRNPTHARVEYDGRFTFLRPRWRPEGGGRGFWS